MQVKNKGAKLDIVTKSRTAAADKIRLAKMGKVYYNVKSIAQKRGNEPLC